jgi:hypothetical protein
MNTTTDVAMSEIWRRLGRRSFTDEGWPRSLKIAFMTCHLAEVPADFMTITALGKPRTLLEEFSTLDEQLRTKCFD